MLFPGFQKICHHAVNTICLDGSFGLYMPNQTNNFLFCHAAHFVNPLQTEFAAVL
jgi:hypothetical protein